MIGKFQNAKVGASTTARAALPNDVRVTFAQSPPNAVQTLNVTNPDGSSLDSLQTARFGLDAVKVQARAELRLAQESVTRRQQIVATSRLSAESAAEALRISEIAYRAGATTNIEVVQAQQTARNAEIVFAVAEDRLRQARLDLLVALGQFP